MTIGGTNQEVIMHTFALSGGSARPSLPQVPEFRVVPAVVLQMGTIGGAYKSPTPINPRQYYRNYLTDIKQPVADVDLIVDASGGDRAATI
jgi:hypothetical protein